MITAPVISPSRIQKQRADEPRPFSPTNFVVGQNQALNQSNLDFVRSTLNKSGSVSPNYPITPFKPLITAPLLTKKSPPKLSLSPVSQPYTNQAATNVSVNLKTSNTPWRGTHLGARSSTTNNKIMVGS